MDKFLKNLFIIHSVFQVLALDLDNSFYTKEDNICMERLGVDKAFLNSHVSESFVLTRGDERYNEYVDCWATEAGVLDDNGRLVYPALETFISNYMFNLIRKPNYPNKEEVARNIVNDCKPTAVGDSGADNVILMANCLYARFMALQ
ncbi:uncharacterized protein LOC116177949 isoform X2 [Photinus pyralis]|uniref:uncharacterized protein LOC116177949 isoform X2 n=1 Tax=Photinus pyralis TaxID=7054 RepID=UPI0012672045|nr:uncharacterized protein LOC116177949 isoform X2 [Photinus pyralis]